MKRSAASTAKQISQRRLADKQVSRKDYNNADIFKKYQSPSFGESYFKEETWGKTFKDFYKTFGCNDFMQKGRPSSKQALRKRIQRPQTSKGIRNNEGNKKWKPQIKQTAFYSQHIGNIVQEAYEKPQKENNIHFEIIVTKSANKKSSKNNVKCKFETDLDDEFLQLFAN